MKRILGLALFVAVLAALGAAPAWAGKTSICHFPPGNPANFHTITVGDNAVSAHVNNHGDLIGSCLENCETICDDGNACTIDVVPDPEACFCTAEPRPQVDCDDGNQCTADACDAANGACTNDPGPLNGSACDDGDPDTTGEVCANGVCSPCPCFTGDDLIAIGAGSPTVLCGTVPGIPGLAGIIWQNSNRACSGVLCAAAPPTLTCGTLISGVNSSQVVSPQEDQACQAVIFNYCGPTPTLTEPLTGGEPETPFLEN